MHPRLSKLLRTTAILLGIAGVGLALLLLLVFVPEIDSTYRARLYKAKLDIEAMQTATELCHQRDGRYPANLSDLLGDQSGHAALIGRIPLSPWGTHYVLVSNPSAPARPYKIWTTPDDETKKRIHLNEISNETDWKAALH
jgi:hypothetical protein